jgi:hypothetical protein
MVSSILERARASVKLASVEEMPPSEEEVQILLVVASFKESALLNTACVECLEETLSRK